MARLTSPTYLAFPFRVGTDGVDTADRARHVRDQIEQVLFTNPGERVFRHDFGAGVRSLVFEPNAGALADLTTQRLITSLSEALKGDVDPRSLTVAVRVDDDELVADVTYTLVTLGYAERYRFTKGQGGSRG